MVLPVGMALRALVLVEMRKALRAKRITLAQYSRAQKIRWPKKDTQVLGSSLKTVKSLKKGFLTGVVYLAPSLESVAYGGRNACGSSSEGCAFVCLGHSSGHLRMDSSYHARAWKTLLWTYRRDLFVAFLGQDLYRLRNRAMHPGRGRKRLIPSARINGSSDWPIETNIPEIFETFRDIVFYDYTKHISRMFRPMPANYHLTFSRSEDNHKDCLRVLRAGKNVAIVFRDLAKAIRHGWRGFKVLDGDETDARPIDETGVVIGLDIKGNKDTDTQFFVEN